MEIEGRKTKENAILIKIQWFFLKNALWIIVSLCLISRILKNLILPMFFFFVFLKEQMFRVPYSAIFEGFFLFDFVICSIFCYLFGNISDIFKKLFIVSSFL